MRASQTPSTADFSVIDPYRMMRTDGSAEKSTRPIVHAWCVRVNINATRCRRGILRSSPNRNSRKFRSDQGRT
jgi:hypothetical protein